MNIFLKDPDARLDYGCDWSAWLQAGETITDAAWSVDDDTLTIVDTTNDGTTTTVWLSAGVLGRTYRVTNHITSSMGRQDDRTLSIQCQQR